ncbi:MAG: hypothetical protein ABW034_12820 [Steroidobacteraceae bacterium]
MRYACAWLLLLLACVHARADESAELDDAGARMEYAYYTRDERALRAGLSDVERMSVPDAEQVWREYQLGLGYWRLAELLRSGPASAHMRILSRCEEHLDAAVHLRPALTEAKAVRGLCAVERGGARASNAHPPKHACSNQTDVAKAFELAPRNPRVLYVQAVCALQEGDPSRALEHAQRASAAFEQAPLDAEEHGNWGQAETCVLLAQLLLKQGDRAAARDRIEQALVLAPDYVAARELLSQIAAGK